MKLLYTAKTRKAEQIFRKYLDKKEKEIKSIRVLKQKPLIVEVVPNLSPGVKLVLKMTKTRAQKQALIQQIMDVNQYKYYELGLKPSDYELEVEL